MKLFTTMWSLQVGIGLILLSSALVTAQITPDQTLPNNSVVNINENTIQIDGGTKAGNNLFHSFKVFSVLKDNTAFFNNALEIQNIFSRVTGNSPSDIQGIIKANGTANLFLINPNGIVFGQNAALKIGGSFIASTADRVIFSDGSEFSATNPQAAPLLTINVPIGLGFGSSPGEIINRSRAEVVDPLTGRTITLVRFDKQFEELEELDPQVAGLQVSDGKTLALVGGNMTLEGGNLTANAGRIEIGSVAGNSVVSLTPIEKGWQLGYGGVQAFQDINLSSRTSDEGAIVGTIVDTSGQVGGDIRLQGRRIAFSGGEADPPVLVYSNTVGSGKGGNVTVEASEAIEINGSSVGIITLSDNNSEVRAIGSPGDIDIATGQLTVLDKAFISTITSGSGQGAKLIINASDSILVDNGLLSTETGLGSSGNADDINIITGQLTIVEKGLISSEAIETGNANAGDINLNVDTLSVRNAQITASTFGTGKGGTVTIDAGESIELSGGSLLSSLTQGNGEGGNLIVKTNDLTVRDVSGISSSTDGEKKAGDITVTASNVSVENRSRIVVQTNGAGDAGNITLNVNGRLAVVGLNSDISADTLSTGDAGTINLNVGQLLVQDGGKISSGPSLIGNNTSGSELGIGGTITINATDSIVLTGTSLLTGTSSSLSTQTQGTGNAGDIVVNTNGQLTVDEGAEISANTFSTGKAGTINLNVGQLLVQDGGTISSGSLLGNNISNSERGAGGTITINATDSIDLSNGTLLTQTESTGNAGSISINTNNLNVTDGSQINARTENIGQAGSIGVTASNISVGKESSISAQTTSLGDGGNIVLNTEKLTLIDGGQILADTTSSSTGTGGTITINATESIRATGSFTVDETATPSGIFTDTKGTGDAGSIFINTNNLNVIDGAQITASTSGFGAAGNIFVGASTFSINNGGQLLTTTAGIQNAGNISIQSDNLTLNGLGSGISANTEEGSSGDGGSIFLNSRNTNINDSATISVNSQGTGRGGDINLQGDRLTLNNQASLSATTLSTDGGNITLNLNDRLLLRNGSNISATAGLAGGGGDGGNISIDSPFIIAVLEENSDITANAFEGTGGNINISTEGIFGIQERNALTPLSDITASSQRGVQGIVTIANPNANLVNRLVEFPENPIDVPSLVAQNVCRVDRLIGSSFSVTGRGGLPPNPGDPVTPDSKIDWATRSQQEKKPPVILKERSQHQQPTIQQVQGWRREADGTIILTADASQITPQSTTFNPPNCQ